MISYVPMSDVKLCIIFFINNPFFFNKLIEIIYFYSNCKLTQDVHFQNSQTEAMTTTLLFQIVPSQMVHFGLFLFVCVYFLCSDVITAQSERIESTDDVTFNSSSDDTHAQTIDVLVFIATSDDRELIGSAHSLGVRLAVDDYGLEEGNTTWIRRIFYHESQVVSSTCQLRRRTYYWFCIMYKSRFSCSLESLARLSTLLYSYILTIFVCTTFILRSIY